MKQIFIFLVVLLPFLAKSQTVIYGKYKYTDSLTFAKYKNNSTLDSVLSVDQNGRLRLATKSPLDTTSLSNRIDARVKYTDTASMLIPYLRKLDTTGKWLAVGYLPYLVKYTDTAAFLSAYYNKTVIDSKLALKLNISDTAAMLSPYARTANLPSLAPYVKYTDTSTMLSPYYRTANATAALALKLNISDTATMLSSYYNKTTVDSKVNLKVNISDTLSMLSPYQRSFLAVKYTDTASMLSNYRTNINSLISDSVYQAAQILLRVRYTDTSTMLSPYARTLSLGGYVPYSGATNDLNIGTHNLYANNFFDGFTNIAASGTQIVLTTASTPSYTITGSGGQTIKLPDATTLPNGAIFSFNNNQTTGAITINNNSNTLIISVPSGAYLTLVLTDNTSAAGSWDAHFEAPSNVSWSTNTFDYAGSFTSGTWNGNVIAINRGGTGASTAAGALSNLGGIGLTSLSASSPLSYNNTTGVFSISQSTTSTNGYLSSTDWNTFNNKLSTTTATSTYVPYTGANNSLYMGSSNIVSAKSFVTSGSSGGAYVKLLNSLTAATPESDGVKLSSVGSVDLVISSNSYNSTLVTSGNTANRTYTFPNVSGTLALTSDLSGYVPTGFLNATNPLFYSATYGTFSIQVANTSQNGYLTSTDWTTFNNKQSALTNPVTGTGTTNYLPKFTGTSTIGNSGIYEGTSGFISIGNTNSTYNLDVSGTGRFSGNVAIGSLSSWNTLNAYQVGNSSLAAFTTELHLSTNAYYNSGWKYITTGNAVRYSMNDAAAGAHSFWVSASGTSGNAISFTEALRIASTGAATFSSSITTGGTALFGSDVFTYNNGGIFFSGGGSYASGIFQNTNGLNLQTGFTPRLTITRAGNVGIGTTSPSKPLEIYQSGSNTAQFKIGDASTSKGYLGVFSNSLYISAGGTYSSGWSTDGTNGIANIVMETSNGGSAIAFGTASSNTSPSERMRVTSGGNLLVGTTTDLGYKFQVAGDIYASGNMVINGGTTWGGVNTQAYGYGHIYKGYTGSAYDVMFINPGNAVDELQVIGGLNFTTTTAGVTFPRMTTTQKNALTKRAGMVVYDTTANLLQCWNGASWNNLW